MSKYLIVTGGVRGIGAEVSRKAAKQGYSVCVNFHCDQTSAQKLVRELEEEGANALAYQADVSQEEEVEALFETIEKDLGTPEALVNNAGILDLQTRVDGMNAERIQRIFAVWAMRGVSLSTVGPGASLRNTLSPLIPMRGRIATVRTTIPMPPSHCINERQKRIDIGTTSMFVRMVAPVVVNPDRSFSTSPLILVATARPMPPLTSRMPLAEWRGSPSKSESTLR